MGRPNRWGIVPIVLKTHMYELCEQYTKLTLRTLHYRLVQVYTYPNVLGFYKYLSRWCARWRREDPELEKKFVDVSRPPRIPTPGLREYEAWFEKDAAWIVVKNLLERYMIPVQVKRGYASLGMYTRALRRAYRRGVRKILYWGDIGPSAFDIERVTRETMAPVKVKRVALTWDQVKQFKLPPRPVKIKDRRAPKYLERYGNQAYEIEALDPRILKQITERGICELVPKEALREVKLWGRAARITREILEPIGKRVELAVQEMLERGLSPREIRRRLGEPNFYDTFEGEKTE